jgi:hypothetical protein
MKKAEAFFKAGQFCFFQPMLPGLKRLGMKPGIFLSFWHIAYSMLYFHN